MTNSLPTTDAEWQTINGKTPWEFACGWYQPDEIERAIADSFKLVPSIPRDKMPTDVRSREFAEWLCNQFRMAMAKGIEIGLRSVLPHKNSAPLKDADNSLKTEGNPEI